MSICQTANTHNGVFLDLRTILQYFQRSVFLAYGDKHCSLSALHARRIGRVKAKEKPAVKVFEDHTVSAVKFFARFLLNGIQNAPCQKLVSIFCQVNVVFRIILRMLLGHGIQVNNRNTEFVGNGRSYLISFANNSVPLNFSRQHSC